MIKRLARLAAAIVLIPGVTFAGGEKMPSRPAPPKKAPAPKPVVASAPAEECDLPDNNVRVLRTNNKAQLNRYVPMVYTLNNVNPFSVVRFIRRTVQMEEGALFTFVNPDGKSGRVLVAVPECQLESLSALIKTIDRPDLSTADGTLRIYRQLKHRRANINTGDPALDDNQFISSFDVYLTGDDHLVIADPEQNAVFFEDTPSGSEYLDKAIVEKLDSPTPQVVLNTKIYELDLNNNSKIGLDYIAWKNGPGANLFALGAFAEKGRVRYEENSPSGFLPRGKFSSRGYNFAYTYDVPSAFFDFLAVKGKARVMNSARIAALNSRPAFISAGDQILYYPVSVSDPSGVRGAGNPYGANSGRTVDAASLNHYDSETGDLTSLATGLYISLTPLIYENGLEVSIAGSLSDFNGFDDTGAPKLNSRDISTSLRMNTGEETILGGLKRETKIKGTNKAPFLGSIPILGYLFGGENTRSTKSEMVIAIAAERIERFTDGKPAVTPADSTIIKQGSGAAPITGPKTTFGFDQLGLDPSKTMELNTP